MRCFMSLAERSAFVDVPIIGTLWPPWQPEVGVLWASVAAPLLIYGAGPENTTTRRRPTEN